MQKQIKVLVLLLIGWSVEPAKASFLDGQFTLKQVQVAGTSVHQGHGSSFSSLIRYNPGYTFSNDYRLGLSLDFSPQKREDQSRMLAMNLLGNFRYQVDQNLGAQISMGTQVWTCSNCGSRFAGGALVSYRSEEIIPFVSEVFFQTLWVNRSPSATQYILGASLDF